MVRIGKLDAGRRVRYDDDEFVGWAELLHIRAVERGVDLLVLQFPAPVMVNAAPADAEAHKGA